MDKISDAGAVFRIIIIAVLHLSYARILNCPSQPGCSPLVQFFKSLGANIPCPFGNEYVTYGTHRNMKYGRSIPFFLLYFQNLAFPISKFAVVSSVSDKTSNIPL